MPKAWVWQTVTCVIYNEPLGFHALGYPLPPDSGRAWDVFQSGECCRSNTVPIPSLGVKKSWRMAASALCVLGGKPATMQPA